MLNTPFLPGLRHQLGRLSKAAPMVRASVPQLQLLLSSLIPPHLLSPPDEGPHSRERCFSLRRTFFAFLWQALNPHASCLEALRQLQAEARLHGEPASSSSDTSPYCQARLRLPSERLDQILRHIARLAEERVQEGQLWLGRSVKIVDGTTFSMPDTPANQRAYPQPKGQKPGCGFPLIRLVGIISLGSGAVLDHTTYSHYSHDIQLFNILRPDLKRGDVVLGDRGFSSYAQISLLLNTQIDSVFRLHQGRGGSNGFSSSFQVVKKLRAGDWLVRWTNPGVRPSYMSVEEWNRVPPEMTVRIVRYRIKGQARTRTVKLVTTLLDHKKYPRIQLAELYLQRWRIELAFRELKTLLRMDVLRCKTPAMIEKEILMKFIAYNLVRLLMQEAVAICGGALERTSFKGALDALRQFITALGSKRGIRCTHKMYNALLSAIAQGEVPFRPGRREPRAVKRRPKRHQFLTAPRNVFREYRHRGKYPNRAWA